MMIAIVMSKEYEIRTLIICGPCAGLTAKEIADQQNPLTFFQSERKCNT